MLSILIPTYNYRVTDLVEELHKQTTACKIMFEIRVYDDASKSSDTQKNFSINNLEFCTFKALPKNIGRSAIRNLLGRNAFYKNLLFIDAGTLPIDEKFIETYINNIETDILVGGMTHSLKPAKKPFKLRWLYTKNRERKNGLHSCNFLIKKDIFLLNGFDETLKGYGYEDVLFFEELKAKNIKITKLENPVLHLSDDNANTFIRKNENAIKNLVCLVDSNKLDEDVVGISRYYSKIKRLKVIFLIKYLFKLLKPILMYNFNSNHPSLFLYDFYRLGYYATIKD